MSIERVFVPGNPNGTIHVGKPDAFRETHAQTVYDEKLYGAAFFDTFQDWLVANDGVIPNEWQYPDVPSGDLNQGVKFGGLAARALCTHPVEEVRTALLSKQVVGMTGFAILWNHPDLRTTNPTVALIVQQDLRRKLYGRGSRFDVTETHKHGAYKEGRYPFADSLAHLRLDPAVFKQ